MENNASVELIDFWPDGYIGHTDSCGRDMGKNFLKDLMTNFANVQSRDVHIYSHFYKQGRLAQTRKIVETITRILKRDTLQTRKKLHGHNTKQYKLNHGELNIWYTSENLRPPLGEDFDLFLSHDLNRYDGRNAYLPIWATRLGNNLLAAESAQSEMMIERKPSESDRKGVCAVISNPEPIRMAFIKEARKYFNVDVYGALGLPVKDKDSVLRNYKFNICFENDEFPGYVTEKPFEAWLNGCIPVWRGLDSGAYLNEDAIINITRDGFSKSIERIHSILNDNSEYSRLSSLPILQKKYDYENLRSRFQSTLYS
jgi:hypothetical protein